MTSKSPFLFKFLRFFLGPLFKLWYKPTVIGKENIPKKGSIIIAGNHRHLMDQCMVIISTKRDIHYLAKKEFFDNKKIAWFFNGTGCIPVDRKNKNHESVNIALNILKDNGAIGIFPEGTRNRTDKILLPFRFGTVSMASKTDAYIVPFGISGSYKFRSKDLTIRFGKPFKVGKMTLEEANEKLVREVERLIKQL